MHYGQQLELNLRAILYTVDYHGWGAQIELDESELKRFKETDAFIDKATCGKIIEKLRQTEILKDTGAVEAFEAACEHRNKLAHSFLAELDFDAMTNQKENDIINRLLSMALDLYRALRISRAVRERAELRADKVDQIMQEYLPGEDPNRHYFTKSRKKKNA